jgi:putative pyruvate formate lyase activating enzyme
VDVYLPDLKYVNGAVAALCSEASDYPGYATAALEEMKRQVGDLETDAAGTARRGLMVRHLVLPGMVNEARGVLNWIAEHLGVQTSISLMSQYYPAHHAADVHGLDRTVSRAEYREACDYAISLGFENGWFQEEGTPGSEFTPEFDLRGL